MGLDQIPLNFSLGCGPGPGPPQLAPWLWAWTRSPSTCPLVVGLDQIPLNFPLGCGPGPGTPPGSDTLLGPGIPPVNRMTDRCKNKNINLPQTSFAGGKNKSHKKSRNMTRGQSELITGGGGPNMVHQIHIVPVYKKCRGVAKGSFILERKRKRK